MYPQTPESILFTDADKAIGAILVQKDEVELKKLLDTSHTNCLSSAQLSWPAIEKRSFFNDLSIKEISCLSLGSKI